MGEIKMKGKRHFKYTKHHVCGLNIKLTAHEEREICENQ